MKSTYRRRRRRGKEGEARRGRERGDEVKGVRWGGEGER
jgi:hypothetical protein